MHIFSGKYKGKPLFANESKTRPTAGKTREAITSILRNQLNDARVLDLFCGSGAVGLELISCGAKELIGIDTDIKMAIKNVNFLKDTNCKFFKNDSLLAIKNLSKTQKTFDIIFLDPPYIYREKHALLLAISNFDILTKDGVIIFETDKETSFPETIGSLKIEKTYKYGYSKLTIFKKS